MLALRHLRLAGPKKERKKKTNRKMTVKLDFHHFLEFVTLTTFSSNLSATVELGQRTE